MNRIKLIIKEKGRFVEIPGVSSFRTPAEVDVTKVKLSILIQSLHSCGINNYELISTNKKGEVIYTEEDFNLPEKKQDSKIDSRLDKLEGLLLKLVSRGSGQKVASSEQITKRLNKIEGMIRKGQKIVYHEIPHGSPKVEELEDQFIPEIDVSEMEISGKVTEVIDKKSEKEIIDSADLLSNLTKNGGG